MSLPRRVDEVVVPRLARGLARVRRNRIRPLTVVAVLALVAVAATGVWRLVRPEPGFSNGTSPDWVGVHDGDSVPRYIESANAKLSALAAAEPNRPVYALLSFAHYLTPDQVVAPTGRVPAVQTLRAFARVPLPGRQTELVTLAAQRLPADLLAEMARAADRKDDDATTYERLAQDEGRAQLKAIYDSNAELSRAEADAYRGACACVFALLVRGTPDDLTALSGQTGVRVIEPAAEITDPNDAVFAAPLPEQTDRVQPLPDPLTP